MQYIGERKIKLYQMTFYNKKRGIHRYLCDKGLLMEYALSNTNFHNTVEITKTELKNGSYESFEYKGEKYLKYEGKGNTDIVIIYKILPQISNDETFSWSKNKRYNVMETTITLGTFEFCCIYSNETGNATIDVKYAKCDNRHHNRVTITTITVNDASNEAILEAINYWKEAFTEELNNIA